MQGKSFVLLIAMAAPAGAQQPLSAIDWLNDTPTRTVVAAPATPKPRVEPPVAETALSPDVQVMPLGATTPEAVGLLPSSKTGLPKTLWAASNTDDLIKALDRAKAPLPAISALISTLLLAEADPPIASSDRSFLVSRIDGLLESGAVDAAGALIERADPENGLLFSQWFDIALLLGDAPKACAALLREPSLAAALPDRIFCLARAGQWHQANLTYGSASALGQISARDTDLLGRFLDPEMAEETPQLPPPSNPSTLQFRLYEAIGEPLPTHRLPRKYAVTDLGGDQGWKAQIIAAERLARHGTLSPNRLLGIYTLRRPAASGGIWDRVEALQRFDLAINRRDPKSVSTSLEKVWPLMKDAGLLVFFSELYGDKLQRLPLTGRAAKLAADAGLLSSRYEEYAATYDTETLSLGFEAAIARGDTPDTVPDRRFAQEITDGFSDRPLPTDLTDKLATGRLGETILDLIALFESGVDGNGADLTQALIGLRKLGLEDTARRASLQLLIAGPSQL